MNTKKRADLNEIATSVVERATNKDGHHKNQAAVELGRLGGQKGGPARAQSLSKRRRSEIAKKAAEKRWAGHKKKG